jgi:hypothetical protein
VWQIFESIKRASDLSGGAPLLVGLASASGYRFLLVSAPVVNFSSAPIGLQVNLEELIKSGYD